MNYRISEGKYVGTDGIDRSNYHLFKSKLYTFTKLHSNSIPDKKLMLHEVSLACKEYVQADNEVTHQAISLRNQMQTFLITDSPLVPTIPRDRPVATQDNRITKEEQLAASIQFFGESVAKRARITPSASTNNLQQRTLFTARNLWPLFSPFLSLY